MKLLLKLEVVKMFPHYESLYQQNHLRINN